MTEQPNSTLDSILQRRNRRRTILRAVGIGLAVVLVGGFLWLRGGEEHADSPPLPSDPVAEIEPAPALPTPTPDVAPMPEPAAAETRPLPSLAESDSRVREIGARLSSRPEILGWLASDELIRRVVAAVDAIARGQSPNDQVPPAMRLKGRFEVVESGSRVRAAPSAPARYDLLTAVATSIDSEVFVRAYRELQPLFEEAHRDLGTPSASFDASIRRAIDELLATPTVVGTPALEPLMPGYGYVDPELEGLSLAQKQLLRFGPANAARIQEKVREIALRLGVPAAELPDSPIFTVPPTP